MPSAVASRPIWLRPAYIGLVAAGGAVGTGLRILAGRLIGGHAWPWATFTVNVVGALALGWIVGRTSAEGNAGKGRAFFGTGLCGGLTTYSTLAVETVRAESGTAGVGYLAVSIGAGLVAALVGLRLGRGRAGD